MEQEVIRALPFLKSDDIEDLLLVECASTSDPIRLEQSKFNLKKLDDEYCYLNFRFYKNDLLNLKNHLKIPEVIKCRGTRVGGTEALCILLRRMAYPNRYVDLMTIFGRSMISFIKRTHGHLLDGLNHPYLTLPRILEFATAVNAKGAPYSNCFGFLDGTVRAICRPSTDQRSYYNGHKRTHALKFQAVVLPNGIIASMFGPVHGRRHDAYILDQSGIMNQLKARYYDGNNRPLFLYGDPAYPLLPHIIVGFKGKNLTAKQRQCNKRMSSVRECVEWEFGKIIKNFAYLDFKKNLKLQHQPVSDFYLVGTILSNCHTCVYGSQTSSFFNLSVPLLEEYLV